MVRLRNAVLLAISVGILITIGISLSIIYSDYVYNPADGLTTLQVEDATYLTDDSGGMTAIREDMSTATKPVRMMQLLEEWAQKQKATLLFKNGVSAGCGVSSWSDWLEKNVAMTAYDTNSGTGVWVTDQSAFQDAYVRERIFFPGVAGLEIEGEFADRSLPGILRSVDILYPLTIAPAANGFYFTDSADTDSLIALFQDNGYAVINCRKPQDAGVGTVIRKLLTDSFLSRTVLFAVLGLMLCFVYIVLVLYRDSAGVLWVHHLFGLSKRRILCCIMAVSVAAVVLAVEVFRAILINGLTYLPTRDLETIIRGTCILCVSLTVLVDCIGTFQMMRRLQMRGA